MSSEDKAYELIALAEEAVNELTELRTVIPSQVCDTIERKLEQSIHVKSLNMAGQAAAQTAKNLHNAGANLESTIKRLYLTVGVLTAFVMIVPLIITYSKVRKLRIECANMEIQAQGLRLMMEHLSASNPNRFELQVYKEGAVGIVLPKEKKFSHAAIIENNREALIIE